MLTKRDRPQPRNEEIIVPEHEVLISITDPKGIITEVNEVFERVSGYSKHELIGSSHNVIRHPDMPRIIFKILWERIKDKENIMAVVKNLAKDGRYYWILTDFVTTVDEHHNVLKYTAYRKPINKKIKDLVTPLYEALCAIEKLGGLALSEQFLTMYLEKLDTTYDEMIEEMMINNLNVAKDKGINVTSDKIQKRNFFEKLFGL